MRVLVALFLVMGVYGLIVPGQLGPGLISFAMAAFVALVARHWAKK